MEVKSIKAILPILQLIQIPYLKQQNNILLGFYSLKFEKSLFNNKLFPVVYFTVSGRFIQLKRST